VARTLSRAVPTLVYEGTLWQAGFDLVAGVDEVGRGSWAGPIVAAAVILPAHGVLTGSSLAGLADSKQMLPLDRLRLFSQILSVAVDIGIGWCSHHVIDEVGIGVANRRAMLRAVKHLRTVPNALLIDHVRLPEALLTQVSINKGDSLSLSIAAASVIAKVTRDRWMITCSKRHPEFGFDRHKGYGTQLHREAIARAGLSPIHRRSFAPCRTEWL